MRHLVVVLFAVLALPAMAQFSAPVVAEGYYKDSSERLQTYVFRTYTDPAKLAWLLIDSGMDHCTRAPRQWDKSAQSYGYRVASGWGRRIVRNTAQLGLETALHEDSRYRRSGQGKIASRFAFAVSRSVLAYKPDGSSEPMYGRMAAGIIASATASTWHPQPMHARHLVMGMSMGVADRAGDNLLQEFAPDLKMFGRRTWSYLVRK